MPTLLNLLEGLGEAREYLSRRGLIVRREDDVVEVMDVDESVILGFVSSRVGLLVYHVDSSENSMEVVLVEDSSLLSRVPLDALVEDGKPKPPSTWVMIADPSLSQVSGRICYAKGNRVRCKPL